MTIPITEDDFTDLAIEAAAGVRITDDTLLAAAFVAGKRETLRAAIQTLRDDLRRSHPNPTIYTTEATVLDRLDALLEADLEHLMHTSAGTDEHCSCALGANHHEDDQA